MYEYDEGLYAAIDRRRAAEAESWPFPGRHESHRDIEEETPIFHALTVGGWRSRQRGSGRAVRSVHRPTVRRPRSSDPLDTVEPVRRRYSGIDRETDRRIERRSDRGIAADELSALHTSSVPEQYGRRRDAERSADRAAVAHLLGGAGRHRLGTYA